MRHSLVAALIAAPLMLAGCGEYGGVGVGYGSDIYSGGPYAYDGYYDGYYGPVYDGYWGTDNYYYYRSSASDRAFRRGDTAHFRRDHPDGDGRWQQFHHELRPERGMRMSHFSPGNRNGDGDRRHDRHDPGDHH